MFASLNYLISSLVNFIEVSALEARVVTALPAMQSSGIWQLEREVSLPMLKPPIDGPTPGQSSGISHSERANLFS